MLPAFFINQNDSFAKKVFNESAILEKTGTVFYTFRKGLIIAVSAKDGKILREYKLGDVMLNPATPINGHQVIFSDVDGNILVLDAK